MEAIPTKIEPMLATLAEETFDSLEWIYEIKWDGGRVIVFIDNGQAKLQSRYLNFITPQFPEFNDLARQIKARQAILDGEIVALDEKEKLTLTAYQNRVFKTKEIQIKEAMKRLPAILMIFDYQEMTAGGKLRQASFRRIKK